MKVELLVNLKIASGKIISAGTIFSDEFEPIPDFVMKRLDRGKAKIVAGSVAKLKAEPKVKSLESDKDKIPAPVKKVLGKKIDK